MTTGYPGSSAIFNNFVDSLDNVNLYIIHWSITVAVETVFWCKYSISILRELCALYYCCIYYIDVCYFAMCAAFVLTLQYWCNMCGSYFPFNCFYFAGAAAYKHLLAAPPFGFMIHSRVQQCQYFHLIINKSKLYICFWL